MKPLLYHLFLCLALFSCIREDTESGQSLQEGDPLPYFTLENSKTRFDSQRDGRDKTMLIIFFTTTCSDCQRAFPDIRQLYNTYHADSSVCVLLIARGQTEEEVNKYFNEQGYTMEFFPDTQKKTYSLFAESIIPRVFLANPSGTIILSQVEKVDADEIAQFIFPYLSDQFN